MKKVWIILALFIFVTGCRPRNDFSIAKHPGRHGFAVLHVAAGHGMEMRNQATQWNTCAK